MAITNGKRALERLTGFRARNWYIKEFPKFVTRLCDDYLRRSEIVRGGAVSSNSSSATATNLTMTRTWCVLNGRMYPISTSSSAITDISNKDISNSAGDQASLVVTFATGNLPSATGTVTISSGGVSFVVRFYSSNAGEIFDTSSSANLQVDYGRTGATATLIRDEVSTALALVFPNHTIANTDPSDHLITITAPVGHGFNFTYEESVTINHVAGAPTNVTVEFGGIIYTDGSPASGVDATSNPAYIALIVTNSDNNGGVLAEGSYAQALGVVSGSASALGSAYPTSKEIQAALDASSSNVNGYKHSGYTGWAHLAQVKNTNGTIAVVSNINNHKNA